MNKLTETIIIALCCFATFTSVQAQKYEGTFKNAKFNCPINGTTEGYLHTSDGKRIDIASYVPLSDGDYVVVSEFDWGTKKCDGSSFKIYFIKDATVSRAQGVRPYRLSKAATDSAKENNTAYITGPEKSIFSKSEAAGKRSSSDNTAISSTGSKVTVAEAEEALAHHNQVRAEVGVAPLSWSAELSRYAQEWADYLANNYGCKMAHRSTLGRKEKSYGENIFWGSGRIYTVLDASKSWYSEIKDFRNEPIRSTNNGPDTGHYSQMVWRNTTEVGMGVARCPNGNYIIVANYNPAGNFINQKAY